MPDSVLEPKSSELLNSTFYSSNSINTLDHARTFRNSLILKEMSDQSLNSSIKPNESFSGATEGSSVLQHPFEEGPTVDSEVQTVNMTTSPSLSALADILNERSKYADQKTRNAQNIESSIIEEEEDDNEQDNMYNHDNNVIGSRLGIPEEASGSLATSSPNLIDIDGFNNIQAAPSNSNSFEAPDFLSTPKVKSDFHKPPKKVHIQPTIVEQENSPPTKLENESTVHAENEVSKQNIRQLKENSKPLPTPEKLHNPKLRSKKLQPRKYTDSSAQRTTSAGSVLEDTSVHKKKKSFFSFFKKKEPKAVVNSNNDILNERNRMSSSNTFSTKNQHSMKTPEKLKKKSHSSSSIFNSFLKGKNDTSDSPGRESIRHKVHTKKSDETKQDLELTVDTNSISSIESPLLRRNFDDAHVKADIVTKPIDQRKLTPLNMDILLGNDEREKDAAAQEQQSSDNVVNDGVLLPSKDNFLSLNYEAPSPAFSKHDTGEVLFPKFLDSHEVDSIVSLERTRSTKSNKRSSMNSQRRSLTDTLSIKAQSAGMFITEASSVVLSTPDLTKSPASSILKSGRFECQDNFSREFSYEGNTNEDHNAFLNIRNDNNLSKNSDIFLNSIEQKFDQLVMASDEEKTEVEKDIPKAKVPPVKSVSETQDLYIDDDNELISDIMEFASFINFGDDDLSLDLDLGTTVAPYNFGKPTSLNDKNVGSPVTFDARNNQDSTRVTRETQPHITAEERFTMYEDDHQGQSPIYEQDDGIINDNDFENEDFNNHTEAPAEVTPRINAYLPEFEVNRPVSMSFKGLKAPRMNASFIDSMTPDTPAKSDITSIGEMDVKDITDEGVRFSSQIILYDTYGEFEYDRHPEVSTCNQLTPQLAQMIKLELNELKSVMEVHDDSRCYTHFY